MSLLARQCKLLHKFRQKSTPWRALLWSYRTTYLYALSAGDITFVIHLFTLGSRSNKCGCLVYSVVCVASSSVPFLTRGSHFKCSIYGLRSDFASSMPSQALLDDRFHCPSGSPLSSDSQRPLIGFGGIFRYFYHTLAIFFLNSLPKLFLLFYIFLFPTLAQ